MHYLLEDLHGVKNSCAEQLAEHSCAALTGTLVRFDLGAVGLLQSLNDHLYA